MLTHFTSFGLHQSLQVASCIHPECTPHNLSAFPSSLHPHRCALPAAPGHRGFWGMEILTIGVIIVLFVVVFKQLCILDPLPIEEGSEIDLELSAARYQPQGLDKLAAQTKFTRKELQSLYRGFKNECPSGLVDEETFKTIYSHFFPQGDSSKYAHFLFNAFDLDRSGSIRFEFPDLPAAIVDRIYRPLLCMPTVYFAQRVGIEPYRQERLVTAWFQLASVFHCRRAGSDFVLGLSLLLRGSVTEKLHWAFNLYDINKDGYITKEEMLAIMKSIYDMMGQYTSPRLRDEAPVEHVEKFFQKMDRNRDGVVTIEEFMETCRKDENIMNSMQLFENVI